MSKDPYSVARKTRDSDRVNSVLQRKDGGRVKRDDSDTNIHIEINGAGKGEQTADMGGPPPAVPVPVPPPGMTPPMGGPPPGLGAGPPGMPPPGTGPVALKRGGGVRAPAGPSIQQQEGGAGGGMGRLQKTKDTAKHK